MPIWWKDSQTDQWQLGVLLTWEWHFACVSPGSKERPLLVLSQFIKPYHGPRTQDQCDVTCQKSSPPRTSVFVTHQISPLTVQHHWLHRLMRSNYRPLAPEMSHQPYRPQLWWMLLHHLIWNNVAPSADLLLCHLHHLQLRPLSQVLLHSLPGDNLQSCPERLKKNLIKEKLPRTDTNMLVSMMALLSIVSCLPMSVHAEFYLLGLCSQSSHVDTSNLELWASSRVH